MTLAGAGEIWNPDDIEPLHWPRTGDTIIEWVLGSLSLIALVLSIGALRMITSTQEQIARKVEGTFRQALGALRTNADETDKMLKSMSARILDVEDKVYRSQSAGANAQAELKKLRKKYARLREK